MAQRIPQKMKDKTDVSVSIYADEFKQLGIKPDMLRFEAVNIVRQKLGLAERTRSRNPNSVSGIMKNREYTDEEKQKIKDFLKKIGKEKITE